MELADKLGLLGLSDQKVKETLKNESLSKLLGSIADQVRTYVILTPKVLN